MRDRKDDCTLPPSLDLPNAFDREFLEQLARREPAPAVPEADFAGPWRVVRLHGDGSPRWGVIAAGEREPHVTCQDRDLAHLAAAGLAVTERPSRFRLQKGADDRIHLVFDGFPVATVAWPIAPGCNLPEDLSRLADLRVQPRALASFLFSVPDDVLRRAGVILAREARGDEG